MDPIHFRVQLVLKTTPHLDGKLLGSQKPRKIKIPHSRMPSRSLLPHWILTHFFVVRRRYNPIGSRWNRYVQSRRVIFYNNEETMVQLWERQRTQIRRATSRFYGFTGTRKSSRWELQIFSSCLRARTERRPKL